MKLTLDIGPDLAAMMAAEIAAGERAVTAAMCEAGAGSEAGLARADHRRRARAAARQLFPVGGIPEGRSQPERRGGGLVEGAGDRRRARCRAADPVKERGLAGDPDVGCRQGARRAADHSRGLGAEDRASVAVRLSAGRAEPARCAGSAIALQVENGLADLPVGAAGQAAEAARSRTGCRAGARRGAGADRGELGGGAVMEREASEERPLLTRGGRGLQPWPHATAASS